jgi:ligand-binding sensor domain-containing protein
MKRTPIVSVRGVVAVALLLIVSVGALVIWRASRALGSASADFHAANDIRFAVRPLIPTSNADFEVISAPAVFFEATRFQDDLYIAGPAGLLEYDASGALLHQYAAGRDLPGSPLIALASAVLADSGEPELILATANDGLLAFNGRSFRQIFPYDSEVRAITAILLDASGHLLIGTKKRGVLVYDGKAITALHSTLKDMYVTALAGSESDLWVGTLDRGVLHFHAGATDNFSEAQGLPDLQVASLAVFGDTTYVGTPLGVAVFSARRFSRVLAPGVLATALLATRNQLYVGTEDQGVISIPLERRRPNFNLAPSSEEESKLSEVRQIFLSRDSVFAVARNGLYRMNSHGFGWEPVLQASTAVLSDRNISALAADANGRLWVGYFDRGMDVLSPDNAGEAHIRESHIEDEHVFCVNRIVLDAKTGTMDVATANGLIRFDGRLGSSGGEQQVLTRADGLIADHVTDVAIYRDGLALATPAGLTFLDASGARSMYAFHGLVNNHVYALGVSGDQLVAGTLGGISVLEKGDVSANYTTATSNLKHNWITAVVRVGAEWMVGTYGAGIVGMDRSGHFHAFENASGKFEVNPNAMLVTPGYVLAGTLGKGLYLCDRQSGRWSVIDEGLPSLNVTALAANGGFIYIGTDNGLVRIREEKLHS